MAKNRKNPPYLVRPDGTVYHVRIQHSPLWAKIYGRPVTQFSLHTEVESEAKRLAAPTIMQHKYDVAKERVNSTDCLLITTRRGQLEPRERVVAGGKEYRCTADGKTVQIFDADDNFISKFPNSEINWAFIGVSRAEFEEIDEYEALCRANGPTPAPNDGEPIKRYKFVPRDKMPRVSDVMHDLPKHAEKLDKLFQYRSTKRRDAAGKDADELIIRHWIDLCSPSARDQKRVRNIHADFVEITGKTLSTATRDDAKVLVKHYKDKGLLWSSYSGMVGWLSTIIKRAMEEDKYFAPAKNVFFKAAPKPTKFAADGSRNRIKGERHSYDEQDIERLFSMLHLLHRADQTILVFMACTGMRSREVLEITGVRRRQGFWVVTIGEKTETSLRTIPIPDVAVPYFPDRWPLYADAPFGNRDAMDSFVNSKLNQVRKRLRKHGLLNFKVDRKSPYSFRHRAVGICRDANVPKDMRGWIFGHNRLVPEDDYGECPMPRTLAPHIEHIWRDLPLVVPAPSIVPEDKLCSLDIIFPDKVTA